MKEQVQRIGVECPVTHYDPRRPLLRHALVDIDTLERLVATLAGRVERAERCLECDGRGWNERFGTEPDRDGLQIQCAACSGTGRRQA